MSDPRLVEPQRVPAHSATEECGHRYWCAKRITATVLLALLLVAAGVAVWWWVR